MFQLSIVTSAARPPRAALSPRPRARIGYSAYFTLNSGVCRFLDYFTI